LETVTIMLNPRLIFLVATVLFGACAAYPGNAFAEVMDKEPTLTTTWMWALVGGAAGYLAWQFRWWLGLGANLVLAPFFVGLCFEFQDSSVGPDILREAGAGYIRWSYCAVAVFFVLQLAGIWRRRSLSSTGRWGSSDKIDAMRSGS